MRVDGSSALAICDEINRLARFVQNHLPGLNSAVEAETMGVDDLATELARSTAPLAARLAETPAPNRRTARRAIQVLGMCVSSIEHHRQVNGAPAGAALRELGLQETMVALGRAGEHPPRDTHYTYWTLNSGVDPLSFTGDRQEIVFARAVQRTEVLQGRSCEALEAICDGRVGLDDPAAARLLKRAAQNTWELRRAFTSLWSRMGNGEPKLTVRFFLGRLRTYLVPWEIDGETWEGINAANVPAQARIDYLLGVVDDDYAAVVEERMRFMPAEDADAVRETMTCVSVVDWALLGLGVDRAELAASEDPVELMRARMIERPELQPALLALGDLLASTAALTSTHWSLIVNYLIKPMATMSEEELDGLAVSPGHGTGNRSHDDTHRLMRMRREHPVARPLMLAAKALAANEERAS